MARIYKLHTFHKWIGKVLKRCWSYVALSSSSRVNFPTPIKGRIHNVKCLFLYTLPQAITWPWSFHLPYKPFETTFARIFLFLETRAGGGGGGGGGLIREHQSSGQSEQLLLF